MARAIFAAVAATALRTAYATDWTAVDDVLRGAVAAKVFPGCAAGVIDATGTLVYAKAFGNYVYEGQLTPVGNNNPAVTTSTLFDMASVSKILGATTTSAVLYQQGLLDLDMYVADPSLLGPSYANNGKDKIRIADCLMHQAGYPPDPSPDYNAPAFGCPATSLAHPPLTFNCSEQIFQSLLSQTLQYPTGTQYIYSDLSMITMQYVLGTVIAANGLVSASDLRPDCASADPTAQPGLYKTCHFEAFVRTKLHRPIGMAVSQYIIPPSLYASAMPTWNESGYYRNEVIQGTVSDDNSYALGGIAGHAGVFSNLDEMLKFTAMWAGYGYTGTGTGSEATGTGNELQLEAPEIADSEGEGEDEEGSVEEAEEGVEDQEEDHMPAASHAHPHSHSPHGERRHGHHHRHGHGLKGGRRHHGKHGRHHGHAHGHGKRSLHRLAKGSRHHSHPRSLATTATSQQQPEQSWPTLVNATTRDLFFTAPRPNFSPRGLGWVVQTPTDTYLGCGNFSALTAYHTGYTGTLLCIDPTTNVSTVLLTNRVYPNSTGQADAIHTTRQAFNNAVLRVLQLSPSPAPGPAQAGARNSPVVGVEDETLE